MPHRARMNRGKYKVKPGAGLRAGTNEPSQGGVIDSADTARGDIAVRDRGQFYRHTTGKEKKNPIHS